MFSKEVRVMFVPGDRAVVFDPSLWKDDKTTPLSITLKLATVVRCYADKGSTLADVVFDHDGRLSRGHFIEGMRHA